MAPYTVDEHFSLTLVPSLYPTPIRALVKLDLAALDIVHTIRVKQETVIDPFSYAFQFLPL